MRTLLIALGLLLAAVSAQAFTQDGCGSGKCTDCHSLTLSEASSLFKGNVDRVLKVEQAEVPGLWLVEVEKDQQRIPLYVDFSKSYALVGNVVRLKEVQNANGRRPAEPKRIDLAKVPLDDALLLGKPSAKTRVVVFTDPECPYCKKLHAELQEVVRRDPGIAFLIKLYPLKMHPNAYTTAKSIVCNKSLALLEASFEGKPVPPPLCEAKAVDETIALVERLGINSTPTLVLPDGQLAPGYKKADDLLRLLGSKAPAAAAGK